MPMFIAISNLINVGVIVIHLVAALFLIIFILLHSGKGSGLSDMFGGSSGLSGGTSVERRLDQINAQLESPAEPGRSGGTR